MYTSKPIPRLNALAQVTKASAAASFRAATATTSASARSSYDLPNHHGDMAEWDVN